MGVETLAFDAFAGDLLGGEIVGAATDALGGEFLASDVFADTVTIFDSAAPTLTELGGSAYQEVGSFAGNSEWVNTFYPGSITDLPGGVIDYSIPDSGVFDNLGNQITNAQILVDDNNIPLLSQDVSVINSGDLTPSLWDRVYSGTADLLSSANIPTSQINRTATNQVVGYTSSQLGVSPQLINYTGTAVLGNTVPGLNNVGYNGPYLGTPGFVPAGSVVGTGTPQIFSGPVISAPASVQAPADYQAVYNDALGTYEVIDNTTGSVVESGLTEQEAILAAQDLAINEPVVNVVNQPQSLYASPSDNYAEIYNPTTGKWDVYNTSTNQTVVSGLSQQAAILAAQDFSINQGIGLNTGPTAQQATGPAYDANGNLNTGWVLGSNGIPIFTGTGSPLPVSIADQGQGYLQGLVQQLQQQQTIRDQRQNKAAAGDWRVRLRLAPQSTYLYNDPACGPVLWPLRNTDGVIFPYTPTIDTAYKANYEAYDLTHSNYRGYFYKGSYVDAVNVRATFTAQDTSEANYLLAVIHFFRSATKMFYGQDQQRGAPPPLVYLSGLGDFQFNEHPCVIAQFNYNLPGDVDYIRAQSSLDNGTDLLTRRNRQYVNGNPLSYALQRLATVGLPKGGLDIIPSAPTLGVADPTYVPTKMEIQLMLYPIQSRSQVSQQFSVRNFANGNLLRGGFW